ncbi:metallophosphoesterase [Auraticoccus sp. F435]|uniref:Metallophosphoesterase n=1 Tax=Auraticoccus cholistanensis TaxID=2656650 RepID=A0A6A9UUT3_9ACTN|nr:metallophosphoesterase [Auraticoccus cholistanensis]
MLSDVHGNLTAYRAVLDDIERRGIRRVLNLGDVAGKGPRGAACVELTRERCETTVRGNWDTFLTAPAEALWPSARWWRDELEAEQLAWLAALPGSTDLLLSGRRIRLVHASATSELVRVHRDHSPEEFEAMFAVTDFTAGSPVPDVVGYGDIHEAYVEVHGERTLFNTGSVGNALDEPTAVYAVLEGVADSAAPAPFALSFVRVPYDVEAEIAVAEALGMPETEAYAIELRTAVYRGRHAALGLTG